MLQTGSGSRSSFSCQHNLSAISLCYQLNEERDPLPICNIFLLANLIVYEICAPIEHSLVILILKLAIDVPKGYSRKIDTLCLKNIELLQAHSSVLCVS